MKTKEIKDRLELLHAVLKYCADTAKTFHAGERIMINQERASLIKSLTSTEPEQKISVDFKVSSEIERKISDIRSKEILNIQMPYLFDEN